MFTDEQQEKYEETCGCECPYCGENNISADYFDTDGFSAWRRIDCLNPDCLMEWTEVFKFSCIEE